MTTKRRVSQREFWLVSLLPAALVLIVSQALPGPAEAIASAERRLDQLTSSEAQRRLQKQLQNHLAQFEASQQELAELDAQSAELESSLGANQTIKPARESSMAETLDELTRRLSVHGVRVLAMERADSRSGSNGTAPRTVAAVSVRSRRRRAAQRAAARDNAELQSNVKKGKQPDWRLSVVATWPAVRDALADDKVFPDGLALSAMKMEPVRTNTALRRWDLVVSKAGSSR